MHRWIRRIGPTVALALFGTSLALPAPATSPDRMFLNFAEDAALVKNQWWEGQLEFSEGDDFVPDTTLIRGVAAFQPWQNVEVGGRVGFGSTDTPAGLDDGSGATDLDVWGKWHFGGEGATGFSLGALVTVPTGDDAVGLGMDSFGAGLFGSVRHQLQRLIISGNIGVRANADGRVFGFDTDGDSSVRVGGGVIVPLSDQISIVGEAVHETERFKGGEKDTRVLGGINWRPFNRGMFRGAAAIGLSDGSPDAQLILGYATQF